MKEFKELFIDKDYNCAETTVRYFNKKYQLGIPEESIRLVSGFGGGMGCEKTCGIICGGIATLGALLVKERAHEDPEFKERCGELTKLFEERFGTIDCDKIKAEYRTEELRCLPAVEIGVPLIEEYIEKLNK